MLPTHAVGIDLGTTYSCIAHLNEHGEPVTLNNLEGESSTPSVVLVEDDEIVVGTEALRNAVASPHRVIQHAKRYMGDSTHRWVIDGRPFSPIDVSSLILKKLLADAQSQIGPIERAVITVPAQFSDFQRHATLQAGHQAGLQQVDIINEPVAGALCHVLGTEGLWFTELAEEQVLLVYDLGGGTFDLSLVRYLKNEVSVIASVGDLQLGGIDWNNALEAAIAKQFHKDFGANPHDNASSSQALALEVEQAKRSLTVRPRSALTVQHGGHRKTYQVEQTQFEKLTKSLLDRTEKIVKRLLKDQRMGWAHVNVVLTTGGGSRMPMVREMLKRLSGRTMNTSLSPDQSIAHGATYYAGMLLTNDKFARSILSDDAATKLSTVRQHSVNARSLGILIRDTETKKRVPFYLLPANTPLPASASKTFGTVIENQPRVNLQIVESGTDPDGPPEVLGNCKIEKLPPNLPEGSQIAVTMRYDAAARVHVDAVDVASGQRASVEIIRQQNMVQQLASDLVDKSYDSAGNPVDKSFDSGGNLNDAPGLQFLPPNTPVPESVADVRRSQLDQETKPATETKPAPPREAATLKERAPEAAVLKAQKAAAQSKKAAANKPQVTKRPAGKKTNASRAGVRNPRPAVQPAPSPQRPAARNASAIDDAEQPVPLDDHGRPLTPQQIAAASATGQPPQQSRPATQRHTPTSANAGKSSDGKPIVRKRPAKRSAGQKPGAATRRKPPSEPKPATPKPPIIDAGEDEFWNVTD